MWSHLGWDNTGKRTASLARELLERQTNLYMNIRLSPDSGLPANNPTSYNGAIKPEWLSLFVDFPDRFFIGIDHHYSFPINSQEIMDTSAITREFLNLLPSYPKNAIGFLNAIRIFKLSFN